MVQITKAFYEDGVLKLDRPLEGSPDRSRVEVTIEVIREDAHPLDGCIGILPDEDAQTMLRAIEETFEQVEPHEL